MPPASKVFYDLGIIKAEGNITSGDAHIAVDYGKIMKYGLKDYERRTKEAMNSLELTDFNNIKKYHFYESILIIKVVRSLQRDTGAQKWQKKKLMKEKTEL